MVLKASLYKCCFRSPVILSEANHKYQIDVPNQFVELRPFYGGKGNSGIESLLEDVTDKQIEDAISLVNGKVIPKQIQTYNIDQHKALIFSAIVLMYNVFETGLDRSFENVWAKRR